MRLVPAGRVGPRVARIVRCCGAHGSGACQLAGAMIQAGVDPGLLDEVIWWRTHDLWFWALEAPVVYVRAAAERTSEPVATISGRIASRRDVQLAAVT